MTSLPLGFVAIAMVIIFSINASDYKLYFNPHALIIVIAGTAAVLFFATPLRVLMNLFRAVGELFKPQIPTERFWPEFRELARTGRLPQASQNPLINYAASLWEAGVAPELFIVLISQKKDELEDAYTDAVQSIRNLAKYPPAFGMTGTVIGLVSLFTQLGLENRAGLGKALALAMTATFFGLVLANGFITPLADRLHVYHMWKKRCLEETYQILILINRGEAVEILKGGDLREAA